MDIPQHCADPIRLGQPPFGDSLLDGHYSLAPLVILQVLHGHIDIKIASRRFPGQ